jgi:aspartate aminotransferase
VIRTTPLQSPSSDLTVIMPQLSKRAQELPASPIRKLAPYAEAAKARGVHVYHLNIGQPDIETPPVFWEAIRQADLKVLAYSPSQGLLAIRQEIAKYYGRLGHKLTTDEVLVTTGGSEALGFTFAALMNPGEEVIIPEPFYANYLSFSLARDARVVPVTCRIEDDFGLPPVEAIEEKISERTRAILICNPGNPTGVLYPESALRKLQEIVVRHDLFLIADEVYREFVYGDEKHFSVLGLAGLEQNTVVVDSISKRFSACGARIGCVISRNRELMEAVLKMAQARLSPPTLGQIGATAMYQLPSEYYRQINSEYAARRDLMHKALNEIEGVYCPAVNGAFYAMVRLPVDNAETFCRWILEKFSHKGATVMIAPGEGFYATPGLGTDEVRIAYVLNRNELAAAMECLREALARYPGSTLAATASSRIRAE